MLLRFGAFELDLSTAELRKAGVTLNLPRQPLRILVLLASHPGQLVTREMIQQEIWGSETFVDFEQGLNFAINKIRASLGDNADSPRYIETLPRRGYRFIAPVEEVTPHPAERPQLMPVGQRVSADDQKKAPITAGRWKTATAAAIALLLAVTFPIVWYRARSVKPAAQPAIRSLAVLPLKNLSGDPTQEYLADGMTEELIGRLSTVHDLRVISRTSIMQFKDTKLSVPEIAKTLNVDAVVEGSVIRDGNRIRVNAQLIRGATDDHFWSESYDRDMIDALDLQSDVARSIARKVEVTVSGQERSRLVEARPVAPEVYENYLKGRLLVARNNKADIHQSMAYFKEAINKDATFAPAYAGLAQAYGSLGLMIVGGSPAETRPKAISAARKALELDPQLAEAHLLLADLYQKRWQWSDAEAEYKRALELKPNDANAHLQLGSWLLCQGRIEEALAWSRTGRELDPLGNGGAEVGANLFFARRYDEAVRELRSFLAVRPDSAIALLYLGFAMMANGQPAEAIPVLEKMVSVTDRGPLAVDVLGAANVYAGHRAKALRLMEELKQRRRAGYVPAGAFIYSYLALGEYDEVFASLEQAYEEQSNTLQFLKVNPFFDPIRGDPRFQDLQRRVGLAP